MKDILTVLQIIVSCLLILFILLQSKGVGLSSAFGGEGAVYRSRRGVEKILYIATIISAFLFMTIAIALVAIVK
ncbi:MAG: preprotein translocase subunit SecG [Patescibacteria group bacterium]|nr:preprotein translocase subunit SecG [Patescibacteria group bacterium]